MGFVLTIASTLARNVQSDSSFRLVPCIFSSAIKIDRLVPCIFSSAIKIERADLIWCSHIPILLAVGGFLFHWIHWPPWSNMNSLIFLWFNFKMPCSVLHWPPKICTVSTSDESTLSFLDRNLWSACMKASVDSEFVDSIWIVLLERHVKRHPYLFISTAYEWWVLGKSFSWQVSQFLLTYASS